jgi:hypothetical protein
MNNHMQLVDVLGHRRDVLERDHCSDGPKIQAKWYVSGLVEHGLAPTRQPHHCTQIPDDKEHTQTVHATQHVH